MTNNHHFSIKSKPLTIGLVAGEISGDILGASLIRTLKEQIPHIRFIGIAGPLMKREGCQSWYEIEELSVMGIVEIFGRLPRLLKIRSDLIKRFLKLQPDIFIGIDSPDFNIFLEKKLKKNGIKTIHYVSPSFWAWRKNRIFKIGESTDLVLAFLPFEKKIYDYYKIPCYLIGHTMANNIPLKPDKKNARLQLKISNDAKYLAILPGSRCSEVEMLTKDFLYAAEILIQEFPKLKILVPVVNKKCRDKFEAIYKKIGIKLPLEIIEGQALLVMISADVTLLASGTATLECMLAKCPMVVGYRMKVITYWLAKFFIKTSYISLPNLLAGDRLVQEFIQYACQPKELAKSLRNLLINLHTVKKLKKRFLELHKSIRSNDDEKLAKVVLELSEK
ncbi:MAG: lipid-A-disaccharide synthase [Arsenophonus sp.]|nr:MAG: lipid-A-disaccharide synthase [Arsenophonus sp.]